MMHIINYGAAAGARRCGGLQAWRCRRLTPGVEIGDGICSDTGIVKTDTNDTMGLAHAGIRPGSRERRDARASTQ
jgi:hypothetical protein